jgi:hypothetical protein
MFKFEEEFLAILSGFNGSNALKHLVLVGSWVLPVYREKACKKNLKIVRKRIIL